MNSHASTGKNKSVLFVAAHVNHGEWKVLRLAPQYPNGPEHAVCQGNEVVSHWFDEGLALEYVKWKNQP